MKREQSRSAPRTRPPTSAQALAWFPEEEWELKAMACRWVPAFSKTLMCHLRKGEVLEKELQVGSALHALRAELLLQLMCSRSEASS